MATSYLTKVFGGDSNLDKWTLSMWVKRGSVDSTVAIYGTYINGSNYELITFTSGGVLYWENYQSSSMKSKLETKRLFRDPAAWYHLVFVWDSANASAGDRARIYVNGVEETEWETDTQPSSGQDSLIGNTYTQQIGANGSGNNDYNGCMSHIHFCDGYAYAASDFGSFDSTSGIWKIKASPSVSYGTNGYFILKDGASVTDASPNSNNWTIYEYITATKDNPSNNFATMNPLCKGDNAYSNGNLTIQTDSSNWHSGVSSLCVGGGKWDAEYKWNATGGTNFGIADARRINLWGQGEMGYLPTGALGDSVGWYGGGSDVKKNGSFYYTADTYSAGDIISIALDCDNGAVYFRKNGGSWQNSGVPTSGATRTGAVPITTGETYFFGATTWTSGCNISANFGCGYFGTTSTGTTEADDAGIGQFKYDVPAGYYALCTKNIKAYGG